MRIAYLSSSRIPSRAANSIQVMKMCEAFARLGHEVTLFAERGGSRAMETTDEIFRFYGSDPAFALALLSIPAVRGHSIMFAAAAAQRIRRSGADLVYSRNLWGAGLCVAAGQATIFEIHDYASLNRSVHRVVFRYVIRHARLVAISSVLREDVVADYPEVAERIIVAHDGADPVNVIPPGLDAASPGRLKVGYIGHLYPGKGFEMIPPLAERASYATFHVVGGDPHTVKAILDAGYLPPNVIMHGHKSYAEAEQIRLGCDVLIAPLQKRIGVSGGGDVDIARWTSPLKLFEYMAAGKPILCSDLPVLREILEHERTALMLPPDDIEAWAEALRRVGDDPELRNRMGAAAREEFSAKYTWHQRARTVLALLSPGIV